MSKPFQILQTWQVDLARDRVAEPAACALTIFKPYLKDGVQVKCACHNKPMLLAQTNGDPQPICTISAWYALLKSKVRHGWSSEFPFPEDPKALYTYSANYGVFTQT
jgi:hypothetical protein